MKNKGISLIVLVITIVIIIILAGAVILNLADKNPIKDATKAVVMQDIDTFRTELMLKLTSDFTFDTKNINAVTKDDIIKYVPSMEGRKVGGTLYTDILVVSEGELKVDGTKANEAIESKKLTQEQYDWIVEALGNNVFNAQTYSIKYYANDGTEEAKTEVKNVDVAYTIAQQDFTRTGYIFNGWNTKADGTGTDYAVGASYAENAELKLYAKWRKSEATVAEVKADPETYYGAYVNYTPKNGCPVKWRVFYSDDTRIYLIAECFVPNSYLTATGLSKNENYKVYSSTSRDDLVTRLTNSSYYIDFKDTAGKASSVVGAPTLEQFKKSYNAVNTDVTKQMDILNCTAGQSVTGNVSVPADGYVLRFGNTGNYDWTISIPTDANKRDLYIRTDDTSTEGMWIASFSARETVCMVCVEYVSMSVPNYNYQSLGVRPLVSLASNVKLVDPDGDGVYDLQ